MTKALIVVDVQKDFVEGGALAVEGGQEMARRIKELMQEGGYDYMVATQDWHISPGDHFETWPVHCKAGDQGADMASPLDCWAFDAVFRKGQHSDGYSGFEGRTSSGQYLSDWLMSHHVTQVDVVGLALDHCVKATALDARRYSLDTQVLAHYTAAVDVAAIMPTFRELKEAGAVIVAKEGVLSVSSRE